MTVLYKILVLVLFAAAGFLLVPFIINIMIKVDLLDNTQIPEGFMLDAVGKSTMVWIAASLIGITSLFIEKSWRVAILLCPLILPSAFIVVYALTQSVN